MKQFKDPFEAAFEEQEESPPQSPAAPPDDPDPSAAAAAAAGHGDGEGDDDDDLLLDVPSTSAAPELLRRRRRGGPAPASGAAKNNREEEEEEEDENMEVELGKLAPGGDPAKMGKMQAILSRFTEEQMNRYESFRRSGFQKATMKRLLCSITGSQKISMPMTIVMSGIAKMFVGEIVETARIVMSERKESGPIRPCHIREAYRRLKLEGKVPKRTVPRLFR
ncbi:transcription initiation factor TFIID subunit 11 isoform X2 [Syzygium oleosum]|uniref:transcription initiation factor TFIID subunit 11 isoform X2 n=1 Tax=Syzygium oleosum TaxID=219896 RepID=UPI0024BB31ED|nr:transcription initiation factor TFIID subunit 11 isoform X2 [Syzygium oleosum]